MKRGTPRHPKVEELGLTLKIPRFSAVGLLELLWHFTAEFCRPGDIGRFSDDSISKALSWNKASGELVSALVSCGWLDQCVCHRLRVHNWPHHADQTVVRVLTNQNQRFISCYDDPSTIIAGGYDETNLPKAQGPRPIPKASSQGPRPSAGADSESLARAKKLFGKRESTALDSAEGRAWKTAAPIVEATNKEGWELLEWAYSQTDGDASRFRRQGFATLLNNWNGEIEKARNWRNGNGTNGKAQHAAPGSVDQW